MWGWRSSRTFAIGLAGLIFVVGCLVPTASLLLELLRRPDLLGGVLIDSRQRGLLINTAVLGVAAAAVSTAIGAPLGLLLGRVPSSRKALLRLIWAMPALIPSYVVGLAWAYADVAGEWTYSLPAAIFVLGFEFYPLPMLATEVAVRRVDARLEEAALMVASPGRVVRRITLPLIAPAIIAAALLVFVMAASDFGVPAILRVRVYTTEVFTAFAALYDVGRAMALTMPLLALCVMVATLAAVFAGDRLVTTRRTEAIAPLLFDRWRLPGRAFGVIVILIALGVPLVSLIREAAHMDSPAAVLAGAGAAMTNSLTLASAGATLVVSVALWLGYARARARQGIGRVADVVCVAMFAVPSTVVGIGLIVMWNRPGALGIVYGTNGMFLVSYVARFLPVAALMLGASARYVPVSQEEAASVAGARWARAMARVVLPQMRVAIAAVWLIVFVLAFGELGASILIAPPGDATLPIRIYTLIANTPPSHVAAFALLQTMVILACVGVFGTFALRREAA